MLAATSTTARIVPATSAHGQSASHGVPVGDSSCWQAGNTAEARFLDTNILLRYLLRDDEEKAGRALALLRRIEQGTEKVVISPMVIFEVVFTLQRRYQVPRQQIRDSVKDILSLRSLELTNKRLYERALDLYAGKSISFPDAFHATYMDSRGIGEIYSWDRDFDRLEGITRVEPAI